MPCTREIPRTSENCLGQFVQDQEVRRIAHIVIGLDHQNIRHQSRLGEMAFGGGKPQIGWNVFGHVEPVVVARFIARQCQQTDQRERESGNQDGRGPADDRRADSAPSTNPQLALGFQ